MTTRKKIKSDTVKKNFRKTRTRNGGIFEPSNLTPLDVTNLNRKSIIKKWREKIKGTIIKDNNQKQTILNELFPYHSLIYKMNDLSTMDDIILTKEEWKDKNSIDDSRKYIYYLYDIEDCNIKDEDFCEPIKLTPKNIASILNKNNQFSNYNRKKRPRELSPTTISVISPVASIKNIEQNTVFKTVKDLKGGKSKKIFRKTRSKRQSGGIIEPENLELVNAVIYNDDGLVRNALEQGLDVNTRPLPSRGGATLLMMAAAYGHAEMVLLLLVWGANVNLTSTLDNYTALMFACENEQFETVDILLNNGANINAIDSHGNTAIFLASEVGDFDIVELLLERGATNVNAKNKYGVTALEAATRNQQTGVVKLLKEAIEIEKKIRDHKQEAMKQVEDRVVKIPSLRTMIQRQLPTHPTTEINEYDFMLPPSKLGGKRKSKRKTNKRFRKTRSKKGGNTEEDITLINATKNGNLNEARYALENGADVNAKDEYSNTALIWASRNGKTEIVAMLVEKGADVNATDNWGYTPLLLASRYGHKEIVAMLVEKGADVNTEVQAQMTALLWATIAGHKDVVEILLQQPGIQVNAADMWGRTPLVNASTMGYTEIVRMLLEAGADIRDTLIMSSGNGHIEIVKMLLKEGADVNETDEDGMTALMMASEWGHKYVVKILLAQEGINVNLWNNEGETALILASKEGHLEIVKMLLKAGALVNMEEVENMNDIDEYDPEIGSAKGALMMASEFGHTEIVKILLKAGADVNAVANDGYDTAITLANGNGHDEIVELLIRKGATIPEGDEDQNIRDKREEILKQKTMAMEVMSRGITRDKEARLLKHGQASVEMGRKVAEYLGGKRKTKKSTRKKRKN